VPWEHVTGSDLRNGLAGRYRTIYLPAVIVLPSGLRRMLRAYVSEGGRLVVDLPGAWYDGYGRLLATWPGTAMRIAAYDGRWLRYKK